MSVSSNFSFAQDVLRLQQNQPQMGPSAPSAQDLGLPATEKEIQALALGTIDRCPSFVPKPEAQSEKAPNALSGAKEISTTFTFYDYFLILLAMAGFSMAVLMPFLMPVTTVLQAHVLGAIELACLFLTMGSIVMGDDHRRARLQQA